MEGFYKRQKLDLICTSSTDIVLELVGKHLPLRDRAQLSQVNTRMYRYFEKYDKTISFLRSVWQVYRMSYMNEFVVMVIAFGDWEAFEYFVKNINTGERERFLPVAAKYENMKVFWYLTKHASFTAYTLTYVLDACFELIISHKVCDDIVMQFLECEFLDNTTDVIVTKAWVFATFVQNDNLRELLKKRFPEFFPSELLFYACRTLTTAVCFKISDCLEHYLDTLELNENLLRKVLTYCAVNPELVFKPNISILENKLKGL